MRLITKKRAWERGNMVLLKNKQTKNPGSFTKEENKGPWPSCEEVLYIMVTRGAVRFCHTLRAEIKKTKTPQ